jgi:hypothetical protein
MSSPAPAPATQLLASVTKPEIIGKDGAVMAADKRKEQKNYKGFVAGVFSGIAKLTGQSVTLPSPAYLPTLLVLTILQWATLLTQSKSVCRRPKSPNSKDPSNVSCKRSISRA